MPPVFSPCFRHCAIKRRKETKPFISRLENPITTERTCLRTLEGGLPCCRTLQRRPPPPPPRFPVRCRFVLGIFLNMPDRKSFVQIEMYRPAAVPPSSPPSPAPSPHPCCCCCCCCCCCLCLVIHIVDSVHNYSFSIIFKVYYTSPVCPQ